MGRPFDKMRKYSEFKTIPGSKGYQINSYGYVFDKSGTRLSSFENDYGEEYIVISVKGIAENILLKSLIYKLFGVKYTKERRLLFNMRLAARK